MTNDDVLVAIDERYTEVLYDGGIAADEDIADYISIKEVLANV